MVTLGWQESAYAARLEAAAGSKNGDVSHSPSYLLIVEAYRAAR